MGFVRGRRSCDSCSAHLDSLKLFVVDILSASAHLTDWNILGTDFFSSQVVGKDPPHREWCICVATYRGAAALPSQQRVLRN